MKKIAVHNGNFHADDVLAVYLLQNTTKFANYEVIRTRDPEIIKSCEVVVDVGGIYDHSTNRYDHHQASCVATFPEFDIPMAACGLVYLHYGKEIIQNVAKRLELPIDANNLDFMFHYLYKNFVLEIDAVDNGISQAPEEFKSNYSPSTDISHRISNLNPHWKTPNPDYDASFKEAVEVIGKDFEFFLSYCIKFAIEQYEITKKAFDTRFEFDPSGKFINIPYYFPIMGYLSMFEGEQKEALYILYPRSNGSWSVRGISTTKQFELRKPLPFPGVTPEEMLEKTGIEGLVFAHKNPFLAVFNVEDQALRYARFAANYQNDNKE
ncbi:hypothetical protein TRFO_24126 [Tritrichomonas foetus]|uniref:Metal-dependent protein hydrolase n=1 Tax=Tritrichomonas foetus TaxID=1144522 RepID=A0A1J4K8A1_9EUKA|nr:hypothetical protein TRFO_24126 [Tritrichomonas foetus]|eukprot:OHT07631.1 hypothetical protein TRFO_24126 [Tritrichomonas foetus]